MLESTLERLLELLLAPSPHFARNLDSLARRLWGSHSEDRPAEERRGQASAILGVALAVALGRDGWELRVLPGEDAVCEDHGTLMVIVHAVPERAFKNMSDEPGDAP